MASPARVSDLQAIDHASDAAMSDHTMQFITFTLGAEEYGVDIMQVREIRGWTPATIIPNAPAYVRGVINLRGVIVPIFDLRARFGIGTTSPTAKHVVIIVDTGERTIGLLVDAVSDILSVEPGDIRAVPEVGSDDCERVLDGLIARNERMVTLVSISRLFSLPGVSSSLSGSPQQD